MDQVLQVLINCLLILLLVFLRAKLKAPRARQSEIFLLHTSYL